MRRVGAGHRQNRLPCQSEREQTRFLREDASGPSRETKPAISKAETSHAQYRSNGSTAMHATGCGRFRLVGRRFPQVHTIRPARPRRRQLASTHCCRTRRVRRIASLCFAFRRGHVAGPSPRQLSGPSGVDWVWRHARAPVTALILCAFGLHAMQRSSCAVRGVHRSIVSSATSSPAR